jgi:hypothetical protein
VIVIWKASLKDDVFANLGEFFAQTRVFKYSSGVIEVANFRSETAVSPLNSPILMLGECVLDA